MSSWSPSSSGWSNYLPSKRGVVETVSGLGGVACGVYGAVSSSVPSGQGYLSSLPAGLKRLSDYLPAGSGHEHSSGDRDDVLTVTFDVDTGPRKPLHFLNVCFSNGFQIWEVLDSDEHGTQATRETQPLREVVSVRQGHTKLVKVLSTVPVAEDSPLRNRQPAVAVVTGDEPGDLNVVRLFSLADNGYVHHMRFHGDVHAVACNRSWFIVCLKNQVILHRLHDLSPVQTLSTFPSLSPQGVVALGPRWLAYASNQPLRVAPEDECSTDPYNTYGSAYLDLGLAAASTAASGAMTLGGLGLRTLNSYLGSSPPVAQAPDQPLEYAGQVMVRDLENQRIVHHFKAHEGPVAIIQFDHTGLMLATAAVDGHNINVFQMDPSHLHANAKISLPRAPRHFYKLVRGVTSAVIDNISFSPDSRWLAVTTRSRTSHLYAINADGNHATVETHVSSLGSDSAYPMYPSSPAHAAGPNTPITLFAVQRIKQRDHLPASVMSRTQPTNTTHRGLGIGALASSCTRFLIPSVCAPLSHLPAAANGIFMVTGEGAGVVLATYQLSPEGKEDPDTLAQTISVDVECTGTMDIGRRRSWREQECNAQRLSIWTKAAEENANAEEDSAMPEWVSNVEIYTHERGEESVWGSKNFCFKSFRKSDAPPADGPGAFIEQVETFVVGGRCAETEGIDPDAEEYFFVQGPAPRPRAAAALPHVSPSAVPARPPPASETLLLQPDSASGVYGGLPSSFGSSQGTPPINEHRMHLQGSEPAGAGSFGSSSRGIGVPWGYSHRSSDEEAAAFARRPKVPVDDFEEEEGVFEMDVYSPVVPTQERADWGGADGDWENRNARGTAAAGGDARCKSQNVDTSTGSKGGKDGKDGRGGGVSSQGLAESTMLFDDDDLGGDEFLASGSGVGGDEATDRIQESTGSGRSRVKNAIESRLPGASAGTAAAASKVEGELEEWEMEANEELVYGNESPLKSGGSGSESENREDKYDGDGSAKGDNETPMNSFSPSGGLQALQHMKNLHIQLHMGSGATNADAMPDGEEVDSWGEPAASATLSSPKKPPRSPKKPVPKWEEEEEEEEEEEGKKAGRGASQDSSASMVEGDGLLELGGERKEQQGESNSSAPEISSSDAEGLSSGLESPDKESGHESAGASSSSTKKKKKKKSKK